MSHRDDPERLLTADGTDLERRLIGAIAHERPSAELRERLAQAICVPLATLGGTAGANATQTAAATPKAAAGASAGSGSNALLPWLSAGVVGLAVAGAIVGASAWRGSPAREQPAPVSAPATVPVASPAPPATPAEAFPVTTDEEPANVTAPAQHRGRARATAGDLRDQIALIDRARTALSTSTGERALELVRQYQDKYSGGTCAPEAAALKIEALAKRGRLSESRALAARFRAQYGESPQTDRVLRAAGLLAP